MKILISVANFSEAETAKNCGVDWLDLKDPKLGSLGKPDPVFQRDAVQLLDGTGITLSLACGELLSWNADENPVPAGFRYAKLGISSLSQFCSRQDWESKWKAWAATLPNGCEPVVVCYADRHAADGLSFEQALDFAGENGVTNVLVDTFSKASGNLFTAVSDWAAETYDKSFPSLTKTEICGDASSRLAISHIQSVLRWAAERQVRLVWAGKLNLYQGQQLLQAGAEVVGFRSAVCSSDRTSKISPEKIRQALSIGRSPETFELL